jgi:hypothetical protein
MSVDSRPFWLSKPIIIGGVAAGLLIGGIFAGLGSSVIPSPVDANFVEAGAVAEGREIIQELIQRNPEPPYDLNELCRKAYQALHDYNSGQLVAKNTSFGTPTEFVKIDKGINDDVILRMAQWMKNNCGKQGFKITDVQPNEGLTDGWFSIIPRDW